MSLTSHDLMACHCTIEHPVRSPAHSAFFHSSGILVSSCLPLHTFVISVISVNATFPSMPHFRQCRISVNAAFPPMPHFHQCHISVNAAFQPMPHFRQCRISVISAISVNHNPHGLSPLLLPLVGTKAPPRLHQGSTTRSTDSARLRQ